MKRVDVSSIMVRGKDAGERMGRRMSRYMIMQETGVPGVIWMDRARNESYVRVRVVWTL